MPRTKRDPRYKTTDLYLVAQNKPNKQGMKKHALRARFKNRRLAEFYEHRVHVATPVEPAAAAAPAILGEDVYVSDNDEHEADEYVGPFADQLQPIAPFRQNAERLSPSDEISGVTPDGVDHQHWIGWPDDDWDPVAHGCGALASKNWHPIGGWYRGSAANPMLLDSDDDDDCEVVVVVQTRGAAGTSGDPVTLNDSD